MEGRIGGSMDFTIPTISGYDDREPDPVYPDEPGWMSSVGWEQLELPDITRINDDNQNQTD